jgi:hypothetical protein
LYPDCFNQRFFVVVEGVSKKEVAF